MLFTCEISAVAFLQSDIYHPPGEGGLSSELPRQGSRSRRRAAQHPSPVHHACATMHPRPGLLPALLQPAASQDTTKSRELSSAWSMSRMAAMGREVSRKKVVPGLC